MNIFWSVILGGAVLLESLLSARAVTFAVSPAAVSNTYPGTITLQISGLTNGETVVVQKYRDLNTNGVINGGDWLVQQFSLTDGQAGMVIGGVTNFNVPGDTDGTRNGQINATLNFQNGDLDQVVVGKYLYKLTSPVGHFVPITNSVNVTNFPFAQKFTGTVVSNGTSTTVSNAFVVLFPPGHNGGPLAATLANSAGNYSLMVPSGSYSVMAFGGNYVANMGAAPVLTLGSGQTIITNLPVLYATNSISGRLVDTNSGIGLPGVGLLAQQSASGLVGVAFTDTNGNYTLPVTAGTWEISPSESTLSVNGYIKQSGTIVSAGATNVTLAAAKATALIYGSIKDTLGNPVVGLRMVATDQNYISAAAGITDANGNYAVGVPGGWTGVTWHLETDDGNFNSDYPWILNPQDAYSTLSSNSAWLVNITAIAATNSVSGRLTDSYGNPLSHIEMAADGTINGNSYHLFQAYTDDNGNYRINLCNGIWTVGIDNASGQFNDSPLNNYNCPAGTNLTFLNNSFVVNFIATNKVIPFTGTVYNGNATITGYSGTNPFVTIPNTINGLPVTSIGDSAFYGSTNLIAIIISSNVTSIGDAAFGSCTSLTNILVPNSVTKFGMAVFWGCSSLTSFTIPASITSISSYAFGSCTSLTNLVISSSVTNLEAGPFPYCSNLTAFTVDPSNLSFTAVDGVLFSKNLGSLIEYPGGKVGSYFVPNSVSNIAIAAFAGCSKLTSIAIPNTVSSIQNATFESCVNLGSITISSSVTAIGTGAFNFCTSLTSVTIPSRVNSISDYEFSSCTNLHQVYFQGNAPNVNGGAGSADTTVFSGITGTAYYIPGTMGWGTNYGGWPTAQWYQPKPEILGNASGIGARTNGFNFTISWATNTAVVVEASTNLVSWKPLTTNSLVNGTNAFRDSTWTNFPKRFYRVRSQ